MTRLFFKTVIILLIIFKSNIILSEVEYLDTSFGIIANGIVQTEINFSSVINSIKKYPINKFIAVGYALINNIQNIALVRYNLNGTLDTSFGSNGIVTTSANSLALANAVAIDTNDSIIIVGTTVISSKNNLIIARYGSNGNLDLNFGTGGIVTKLIGTSTVGNSVVIDADGKIIVAGTAVLSGNNNMFIARYNSNGSIDSSFGTNGVRTLKANNGYTGNSIQIDQNAKLLIGGAHLFAGGVSNFLLVRLNVDGTNDATFGTSGVVSTAIPNATTSVVRSIYISSSNKIIAGGYSGDGTINNFTIVRYNTNGTLDISFGTNTNGIEVTNIGSNSQINSILVDSNEKIFAAGFSNNLFAIAKYLINGSLDTTFGFGGILTTSLGNNAQVNTSLMQNIDERVIAAGAANNLDQFQFTSLRYNKNNTDFINVTSIEQTVNTKTPIIGGISSIPNAQVEVIINDVPFTIVSTNSVGDWTAGQTSLLPAGQNKIQVNLIVNSVIIVSQAKIINVFDNLSDESAFAYNTQAQTTNNPEYEPLSFNEIPKLGTWTYADSVFICKKSGIYLIQYTGNANINGTVGMGTSAVNIAMSIAINDIEYLGSETDTNIISQGSPQNHYAKTLTRSFVKSINEGDTLTLNFAVSILGDNTGFTAGLMNNPNAIGTQPCYSLTITRIG